MATIFRHVTDGTDFDDMFDPYIEGTKPANTGFRTADGVDLANRYAPIEFGSKRADVGYRLASGVDLSNLWAAKGTAVYAPAVISAEAIFGNTTNPASVEIHIKTNGTMQAIVSEYNNVIETPTWNYVPTAAGASAAYDFRIFGTITGLRSGGATTGLFNGKGGVAFSAEPPPGNSAAFDTGWQSADDANYFLRMSTSAAGGAGAVVLSTPDGEPLTIQVRRKSDLGLHRTFAIDVSSISDGTG